jgi:Icc-related predicted phosphoesterase
MPSSTEILVTHSPPFGTHDQTMEGVSVGCPELSLRRWSLPNLRLHVFGHIHEAFGASLNPETGVVSVNCALKWMGQPVIVDLINNRKGR